MDTNEIQVAVGAGRFDADHGAVTARCERAMRLSSLYLSTEVMHDQRPAFAATGCEALFLSEFAALYDPAVWEPVAAARLNWLTRKVSFNRGHIRIKARDVTFRLRHIPSGLAGYFDVEHLPAHIQDGDNFTTLPHAADEVRSHRRAVKHAGERSLRRRKWHPGRFQFWCGDVNLDLHRERWRRYMSTGLHMLGAYDVDHKVMGDLGGRLVTAAWGYNLREMSGRVLLTPPDEHGLDHRLTVITATLR